MASNSAVLTGAAGQQATQAALATVLTDQVEQTFRNHLDVADLKGSLPGFTARIAALVQQFGRGSATTAAKFYTAQRRAAGVPGSFTVRPVTPAKVSQVNTGVRWATKGLWSANPDIEAAQAQVVGVAEKSVLDTGRLTLIDAVNADRKALGWARVAEPGCCAFCALLTTRGMAYRSERSGNFRSHNHCRCHVEPVFTQYEPSALVREWQALYQESTTGARGPVAMRAAFRKAFDSRYL